jgi:hypothetical protein
MMRFLVRSSFLFLFCVCIAFTLQAQQDCVKASVPIFTSVRYRASIDVLDKHLSGILIFKTMEDESIRTVFLNEMGVTFFDMTFYKSSYVYHSIMKSLDKKAVRISLAKDLGMILVRGIFSESGKPIKKASADKMHSSKTLKLKRKGYVNYFADKSCTGYWQIENWGAKKKVVSITQKHIPELSMPDSIFVQHHNVHFTISLKHFHAAE